MSKRAAARPPEPAPRIPGMPIPAPEEPENARPGNRRQYQIRKKEVSGGGRETVMGYELGSTGVFFAWRQIEHSSASFSLSHVPTGLSIGAFSRNLSVLAAVAQRLEEMQGMDWSFTDPESDAGKAVRDVVLPFLGDLMRKGLIDVTDW